MMIAREYAAVLWGRGGARGARGTRGVREAWGAARLL